MHAFAIAHCPHTASFLVKENNPEISPKRGTKDFCVIFWALNDNSGSKRIQTFILHKTRRDLCGLKLGAVLRYLGSSYVLENVSVVCMKSTCDFLRLNSSYTFYSGSCAMAWSSGGYESLVSKWSQGMDVRSISNLGGRDNSRALFSLRNGGIF